MIKKEREVMPIIVSMITAIIGIAFSVGMTYARLLTVEEQGIKNQSAIIELQRDRGVSDRITNDRITSVQIEIAKLNGNLDLVLKKFNR